MVDMVAVLKADLEKIVARGADGSVYSVKVDINDADMDAFRAYCARITGQPPRIRPYHGGGGYAFVEGNAQQVLDLFAQPFSRSGEVMGVVVRLRGIEAVMPL